MFHKILVPLDGSPEAESVLLQLDRPAMSDAEVLLLHVVPPVPQPVGAIVDQPAMLAEKARAYLDAAAARVNRTRVGKIVRLGDAADEIVRAGDELRPDLVAMTTHGRGGLSRLIMGSVAESVVRRLRTPVFFVRPDTPPPARLMRRVLLPIGGDNRSFGILEVVKPWAAERGAEIVILHVQPIPVAFAGMAGMAAASPQAMEPPPPDPKIVELPLALHREGLKARILVEQGDPVRTIVERARQEDVDLIAMATGGRGGLARLFLGSVAEGVLRHSDRPVLLQHLD